MSHSHSSSRHDSSPSSSSALRGDAQRRAQPSPVRPPEQRSQRQLSSPQLASARPDLASNPHAFTSPRAMRGLSFGGSGSGDSFSLGDAAMNKSASSGQLHGSHQLSARRRRTVERGIRRRSLPSTVSLNVTHEDVTAQLAALAGTEPPEKSLSAAGIEEGDEVEREGELEDDDEDDEDDDDEDDGDVGDDSSSDRNVDSAAGGTDDDDLQDVELGKASNKRGHRHRRSDRLSAFSLGGRRRREKRHRSRNPSSSSERSGSTAPAMTAEERQMHGHHLVKLLTVQLTSLFHKCNADFKYYSGSAPQRVLTKNSRRVSNNGFDNSDGNLVISVNDILHSDTGVLRSFRVMEMLGQGTFGQVLKCEDCSTRQKVALKVIKNKPAYHKQAMAEVRILSNLRRFRKPDGRKLLSLLDYFMHKNHLCLVFEMLSVNLYELVKQNRHRGFVCRLIRSFVKQLLDDLVILHDARIIHCDLKPENILLESMARADITLIDYGSACYAGHTVYSYIQSRFYRSIEVLLGMEYDRPIDMWSLGCIAAELFLGLPVFPGNCAYDQIRRIISMLGPPPDDFVRRTPKCLVYFKQNRAGSSPEFVFKTPSEYTQTTNRQVPPPKRYFKFNTLEELLDKYPYSRKLSREERELELEARRTLLHFLRGVLQYDPDARWTPHEAREHPFILGQDSDKLAAFEEWVRTSRIEAVHQRREAEEAARRRAEEKRKRKMAKLQRQREKAERMQQDAMQQEPSLLGDLQQGATRLPLPVHQGQVNSGTSPVQGHHYHPVNYSQHHHQLSFLPPAHPLHNTHAFPRRPGSWSQPSVFALPQQYIPPGAAFPQPLPPLPPHGQQVQPSPSQQQQQQQQQQQPAYYAHHPHAHAHAHVPQGQTYGYAQPGQDPSMAYPPQSSSYRPPASRPIAIQRPSTGSSYGRASSVSSNYSADAMAGYVPSPPASHSYGYVPHAHAEAAAAAAAAAASAAINSFSSPPHGQPADHQHHQHQQPQPDGALMHQQLLAHQQYQEQQLQQQQANLQSQMQQAYMMAQQQQQQQQHHHQHHQHQQQPYYGGGNAGDASQMEAGIRPSGDTGDGHTSPGQSAL